MKFVPVSWETRFPLWSFFLVVLFWGTIAISDAAPKRKFDLAFPEEVIQNVSTCGPTSPLTDQEDAQVSPDFCAKWNPDFAFYGGQCCGKKARDGKRIGRRRTLRCTPHRAKTSYCDEMIPEQRDYVQAVESGQVSDVLSNIED